MQFIFETERLGFREITGEDAQIMFDLNADSKVIRYTGDGSFESVEEARGFLEQYSDYKRNGYGRWAVVLKSENRVLGWCGLKLRDDGVIDLGYRFFQNEWGKGYATGSANACLEYGFSKLGMNEIIGQSAVENFASVRVLEKLGMSFWKQEMDSDGLGESVYYKISKTEFKER